VTVKVLDASAVASMAFLEPTAGAIQQRVRDCEWLAPSLLKFELANICARKIRAMPQNRDTLIAQHRSTLMAPVSYTDVNHEEAVLLAELYRLTAYDASYLWLAKDRSCELVTLDEDLAKAFQKMERQP
jgi:predicted nucleic acid-binding protein